MLLSAVIAVAGAMLAQAGEMPDRLLYCPTNLQVEANVTALESLFARAEAAGYTGVLLADTKFARLGDVPEFYFEHARRVRAAAAAHGLAIVPAVFPIGYSNDILWHNPNLAEALPVHNAEFVVRDGVASIAAREIPLPGGAMEDLGAWSWHDATVEGDGGAARVRDPRGANARFVQRLTLEPFRQYHVSVRIRTHEFSGTPEIKALAVRDGGEPISLIYSSLGVAPTQEWATHHAVFNTLEHSEIALYFGCWDGSTGTLWWDDAAIEEVGLLNLVRRAGAPLAVEAEGPDGSRRALVEGVDFEPVADPAMGTVPWPGEYTVWHEPPTIRMRGDWPDGSPLRVSYHHVVTIHDGQVMICPSEPATLGLLRDQAERVHELWDADAYFMSHDEIRCLNQDRSCLDRGLDAGEILAANVRACTEILGEVAPGARVYVWSDMFDPAHNAHGDYYLVRGDLAGSWEGLDPGVVVACWYFEKRRESIGFFTGRGHPVLIAGYYDGPVVNITRWLEAGSEAGAAVGAGAGAVRGVMYTTWRHEYSDLEAFAARAWGG